MPDWQGDGGGGDAGDDDDAGEDAGGGTGDCGEALGADPPAAGVDVAALEPARPTPFVL